MAPAAPPNRASVAGAISSTQTSSEQLFVSPHAHKTDYHAALVHDTKNNYVNQAVRQMEIHVPVVVATWAVKLMQKIPLRQGACFRKDLDSYGKLIPNLGMLSHNRSHISNKTLLELNLPHD